MINYETDYSQQRQLNWKAYQAQYALYLSGELNIPGAEQMNELELATILCPEYAVQWASDLQTKYGDLLSKGYATVCDLLVPRGHNV